MTHIDEVARDVFRICTYIKDFNLQFSQFLIRDEEPLLLHTGMNQIFPEVREAVGTLIDPGALRWISFSHFESDECGSLARWQEWAPESTAVCSLVGKLVSVDDVVALRPARPLADDEVLVTGSRRFRFIQTPHVPHGWDAGVLFEESERILFCSDLFHQTGEVEAVTESDIVGRAREVHRSYIGTPFADYLPYTAKTAGVLARLADLNPGTLATMHGSVFRGDGATALRELDGTLREIYEGGN